MAQSDARLLELEQTAQATLLATEIEAHAKALAGRLLLAQIRMTLNDSPVTGEVAAAGELVRKFVDTQLPSILPAIIFGCAPALTDS